MGEAAAAGADGRDGHPQRRILSESAQLSTLGEHAAVQARGTGESAGPAVGAGELGDVLGADRRGGDAVEGYRYSPMKARASFSNSRLATPGAARAPMYQTPPCVTSASRSAPKPARPDSIAVRLMTSSGWVAASR